MRRAEIGRSTKETAIQLALDLDGSGHASIRTGIGFLDHMIATLARFARFDLELECRGDLFIDDHHTAEDCALALGKAIDQALSDRAGIERFGHAYAPLDEALARAVIDLSGRPFHKIDLGLARETLGTIASENLRHFLQSLAISARMALHVELLSGENDHHKVEAAFKAVALALRMATRRDGSETVPSEKGVL